jgi:hypothetical protein
VKAVELARQSVVRSNSKSITHDLAVLSSHPAELWWAWIVPIGSVRFARTRDPADTLHGLGPCLVDKRTGEVIRTRSVSRVYAIERARGYRPWWKLWGGPNRIVDLHYRLR